MCEVVGTHKIHVKGIYFGTFEYHSTYVISVIALGCSFYDNLFVDEEVARSHLLQKLSWLPNISVTGKLGLKHSF